MMQPTKIACLLLVALSGHGSALAFLDGQVKAFFPNKQALSRPMRGKTEVNMCICINCARVTNCQAYHFVESKHNQPHMAENPTFMPRDGSPTIHVNVRTVRTDKERKKEAERMWSEHQSETEKAEAAGGVSDESLVGEQKYDLSPVTTYEYDVVKCADYVNDAGCWIRNMPEEIKLANPDFVPS